MTSCLLHLTPGGVISPKPVITPPKHMKSAATGKKLRLTPDCAEAEVHQGGQAGDNQ